MNYRVLSLSLAALLFTACGASAEQVAVEQYLTDAEAIADQMVEMGAKFETLINVQQNMMNWSAAEKQEITALADALNSMINQAEAMNPPAILADIHPTLIDSLNEMLLAVEGIETIAKDPSKATEALAKSIEDHATAGEELGTEYADSMEAAVKTAYPELLE